MNFILSSTQNLVLILRLDVAVEFVHSHSESKDVPEDVRFKAKMVSGYNDPIQYQKLTKPVAQLVYFQAHVSCFDFFSLQGNRRG